MYAGWWLLWICVQTYLLVSLGFDLSLALTDATLTQVVLALAGYTINTSMHSYQPSPKNSLIVLSWSVALAGICIIIQRWGTLHLVADPVSYVDFLDRSLFIRGVFAWLMILLIAILTWFWVYIKDSQESEKRREDAANLAREAELSNLRMQMQPHFLFNSLNSISALVASQPEKARAMIQQLSDFLRGTVKREERQLITLEEELQHLQLYLDIEKVRFGHRLSTEVSHDEVSLAMKLPSLLLQPVVENAIKFGLYDTVGEITITIAASAENSRLKLEVTNPFDPATAQPRKGTGFGLPAIQRRLYLLYFQKDLLQTRQEENTFITTLTIPQPG
jgi:two-component system, LytTR family, sensor kinase